MSEHLALGKKGEDLASEWLQEKKYNILHRNWRYSHVEVDIIAEKEGVLHFIEVKTRRTTKFGMPEESVDEKKLENLMRAAEEYLFRFPDWERIQYDVLAIHFRGENIDYFFLDDVYL
ncbi:MAG: YraN family protein [Chitinophagales bacterium]